MATSPSGPAPVVSVAATPMVRPLRLSPSDRVLRRRTIGLGVAAGVFGVLRELQQRRAV